MQTKLFVVILTALFWPLSLYFSSSPSTLTTYFLPSTLIALSFFFYYKSFKHCDLPLIAIPFVTPKLSMFPLIYFLLNFTQKPRSATNYLLFSLSFITLLLSWKGFIGQTIFIPDYEAQQKVIRDQHLYPSVFMARMFHNKAQIITDKFNHNLLALTDPSNYFFGFHPREMPRNDNLPKFPFAALPFVLFGFYSLQKNKFKFLIISFFISSLVSLSFLTLFDKNDFILWFPLSFLFALGFTKLTKRRKKGLLISLIYFIFLVPDLISIFLRLKP